MEPIIIFSIIVIGIILMACVSQVVVDVNKLIDLKKKGVLVE